MSSKHLPPDLRRTSLADVFVPQRLQWAVAEASRCLMCDDAPCQQGCAANVDIKKFIRALRSRNIRQAANVIRDANFLIATCGRICPQRELCEARCTAAGLSRPIAIGELQRFVGETVIRGGVKPTFPEATSRGQVGIIGAGPAGLAAAYYLRRAGIVADLYERRAVVGGIPMVGIPTFRLPRAILNAELAFLADAGIQVIHEEAADLAALATRYAALFVACGLGGPRTAGIPGETLRGVFVADHLLETVNLGAEAPRFHGPTVVLGGGNTAFDAASLSLRLGSGSVLVAYRRSDTEMPAWREHRDFSMDEGVTSRFLLIPEEILGDGGAVSGVRFSRAALGAADRSGRRLPHPIPGSHETIACSQVVLAIGNDKPCAWESLGLKAGDKGPAVDPATMATSRPGIFAGGDLVNGGGTVVQAVADGRRAAAAIAARIFQDDLRPREP
ncbi:MAG: FAD-dependent oxidoreductase [Deltaproteobacteria bacterium]|nr:FAD-dependent oxidoreductase [Deltaproteobacteria bacterium]